jgi:divalent metal cation (Fe/Co/Zn/Cd) transporter|tara:strand:- start:14884 stop:14991 length:108 start_codon:yes stop_codon:yes gene_type:complete
MPGHSKADDMLEILKAAIIAIIGIFIIYTLISTLF